MLRFSDLLLHFAINNHNFIEQYINPELDSVRLEQIADSQWQVEQRLRQIELSWVELISAFERGILEVERNTQFHKLNERQKKLVKVASFTTKKGGEQLSKEAGVLYNTNTKTALSFLVGIGILTEENGYLRNRNPRVRTNLD